MEQTLAHFTPAPLPTFGCDLIRCFCPEPWGGHEATRVHQPARCCGDVAGPCAGANGQDFAHWIPWPLVAIPGVACRRRLSTKTS
jgi:hypothetical protein